jgi:hypothetical protein
MGENEAVAVVKELGIDLPFDATSATLNSIVGPYAGFLRLVAIDGGYHDRF